MIYNASRGYNVTILAYGQTNSGKTYTITGGKAQGSQWQPGIIELSVDQLFKQIEFLKSTEGIEHSLREQVDLQ